MTDRLIPPEPPDAPPPAGAVPPFRPEGAPKATVAAAVARSVNDALLSVLQYQAQTGQFDMRAFVRHLDAGDTVAQKEALAAVLQQWRSENSGAALPAPPGADLHQRVGHPHDRPQPDTPHHDTLQRIDRTEPFRELVEQLTAQVVSALAARPPGGARAAVPRKAAEYALHTSQEWAAIMQAVADGKYNQHYVDDEAALARIHARPNAPFHTRLDLLAEEREAGFGVDLLKQITDRLDVDAAFALLYISHCLAPPAPLPQHAYAGGWVDLNDVAAKIGLRADTTAKAEENRRLVWDYIRFGARAHIVGERSTAYYDTATRRRIQTQLDTALWAVISRERPIQPALFEAETVPVRVELVASREWTALTTAPATAQYLPLGEVLGSIPGKKPSGAWARSIGLAYTHFCRRKPREALDGSLKPTREQLLSLFPAKETPYTEFLNENQSASRNPARLLRYWCEACKWLVERGVFAPEGEAVRTAAEMQKAFQGKYHWTQPWLQEAVDLRPGPRLRPAVEDCANGLPPAAPPATLPPGKRRPGRPRKHTPET